MEGGGGLRCGVRGGWGRSAPGEQESWTPEGMWGPLPVPLTLTSIAALSSAPRSFLCRPSSHWGPSTPSLGSVLPSVTGGLSSPSLGPVLPTVTGAHPPLSLGARPPCCHWGPVLLSLGPVLPITGTHLHHHWGPSSPSRGPVFSP